MAKEYITYSIFDPTGNITALVGTEVGISRQPGVASEIMKLHPEVEQVGFVRFDNAEDRAPVRLRMAGGEFCGNATMCAAVLRAISCPDITGDDGSISVQVDGVSTVIDVRLRREDEKTYYAGVLMPKAKSIGENVLNLKAQSIDEAALGAEAEPLSEPPAAPLVRMEGIDHLIIGPDSVLSALKNEKELAESLIRSWCEDLDSSCLGMMFLGEGGDERELTPLVYVPGADTMYWENSCASGSAAAGMWLASERGEAVDVTLDEPAGKLRVLSDPSSGEARLFGSAKLLKTLSLEIDTGDI